jgi:hypothetical protein
MTKMVLAIKCWSKLSIVFTKIHKHQVCTKLDIYFFITITGSITLATGGLLVPEGSIGPVVSVSMKMVLAITF